MSVIAKIQKAAIRQMSEALVNDSLIIFPEGTRKMDDDLPLQPFKSGLFYLAKETLIVSLCPFGLVI